MKDFVFIPINFFYKYIIIGAYLVTFLVSGCVQPDASDTSNQGNQNPIITSLSADPNPVMVGNITIITCEATDPQGGNLTYQWYTSLGDISGQGKQVQYSATYCCAGSVTITVIVRNNLGGSTQQSFFVNVTL